MAKGLRLGAAGKVGVSYSSVCLIEGRDKKDYGIFGSILGSPYLKKRPALLPNGTCFAGVDAGNTFMQRSVVRDYLGPCRNPKQGIVAILISTYLYIYIYIYICRFKTCHDAPGVLLGVAGSALTSLHDAKGSTSLSSGSLLLGDLLALVSAASSAIFVVQARVLCPKDEAFYSMQLVLGYGGFLLMMLLATGLVSVEILATLEPCRQGRFSMSKSSPWHLGATFIKAPVALWQASSAHLTWAIGGALMVQGLVAHVFVDSWPVRVLRLLIAFSP